MKYTLIALGIVVGILLLIILLTFICFFLAFYSPSRPKKAKEKYPLPFGEEYKPYHEAMIGWIDALRAIPYTEMSVQSFDGLTLRGRYYETKPGAVIEIMIHGYRASGERDLCAGVQRAFAKGRNVLLIDQRGSGRSDGHVITFGVRESRDCLAWVDMLIDHFGPDVQIVLTGISMGAATVMIAAGTDLPPNVISALADCGYTSAEEIIKKVIHDIHLPVRLFYPLTRLGARLFGRFDPESASPIEAMKTCKIPIMFVHGEADNFVPCDMSLRNYEACTSPKRLLTVPGAGHGLSYPKDPDTYISELELFLSGLSAHNDEI